MIISRSADYALRALLYLTRLEPSSRFVPANEISNEMQTPPFLLSRILQRLVKSGMLQSMKGHHGGFRMSKAPGDINVYDVIKIIDGAIVVHDCVPEKCGMGPCCNLRDAFTSAERALELSLRAVTLADLNRPQSENFVHVGMGATSRSESGAS
jgi:Rrf2 family nitric oxide-sensitive transcriptional repressor